MARMTFTSPMLQAEAERINKDATAHVDGNWLLTVTLNGRVQTEKLTAAQLLVPLPEFVRDHVAPKLS